MILMWPFKNYLKEENKLLGSIIKKQEELIEHFKKAKVDTKKVCLLGAKVICRSNEVEPLLIGIVVGFQEATNDCLPIVSELESKKKYVVWGIVRPYNEDLLRYLNTLTPAQQWKYLAPDSLYQMSEDKKEQHEERP